MRIAILALLLYGAALVAGCTGAAFKPEDNPPCNPWPHPGGQC
jgi:hypothetical protein